MLRQLTGLAERLQLFGWPPVVSHGLAFFLGTAGVHLASQAKPVQPSPEREIDAFNDE